MSQGERRVGVSYSERCLVAPAPQLRARIRERLQARGRCRPGGRAPAQPFGRRIVRDSTTV